MIEPRQYQDYHDIENLHSLLASGRRAGNGCYYVHPGDVSWWLYYPPVGRNLFDQLYFWYEPHQPDHLLGWALLGTESHYMDVFVQPELRETQQAWEMFAWVETTLSERILKTGGTNIRMMWISERDGLMMDYLSSRGFRVAGADCYFTLQIKDIQHHPQTMPGFIAADMVSVLDKEQRAAASYSAFGSSADWDAYVQRYMRFTNSPVYDPHKDIVITTAEGRVAAFCNIWIDSVNRVGLFEPVGVHSDFQGQGFGKLVVKEGIMRMRSLGMEQAIVTTSEDNIPARKLYESVGFHQMDRLLVFQRELAL